jgi:glutaredoxin 3
MSMFEPSKAYKPFLYPKAVEMTVESERMHWTEEELELADDVNDWKLNRLTPSEKDFITQILRMFTQSDVNVGTFYLEVLIPQFRNNEIRNMLASFVCREGTHQRGYALLNDTLGLPEGDYTAFLDYKEMADKHEFMLDADPSTKIGLARALAKAAVNEGISLFASFAMLLNFQRRGLMKGMGKVVEWSIKDETKHVEGIAYLFRTLCNEFPEIVTDDLKGSIYQMLRDGVDLEDAFIDLAYAMGPVEGCAKEDVKQYIRFIADRRASMLGLKEIWGIADNPLPWIDVLINAKDHTNFFENKVADYEVGALSGEWDYNFADWRIYGRAGCEYCDKAKDLFALMKIPFHYVALDDFDKRQDWYDARGFREPDRSVPKIYRLKADEEVLVGGYNAFHKLMGATL